MKGIEEDVDESRFLNSSRDDCSSRERSIALLKSAHMLSFVDGMLGSP